jgi:hypothetical protein
MDDDPDVCARLRDYLGKNEFRVTAVHSGKRMLETMDVRRSTCRCSSCDCAAILRRSRAQVPGMSRSKDTLRAYRFAGRCGRSRTT